MICVVYVLKFYYFQDVCNIQEWRAENLRSKDIEVNGWKEKNQSCDDVFLIGKPGRGNQWFNGGNTNIKGNYN